MNRQGFTSSYEKIVLDQLTVELWTWDFQLVYRHIIYSFSSVSPETVNKMLKHQNRTRSSVVFSSTCINNNKIWHSLVALLQSQCPQSILWLVETVLACHRRKTPSCRPANFQGTPFWPGAESCDFSQETNNKIFVRKKIFS